MSGMPPHLAYPNSKHPMQPRGAPPSENEIKNPKLKILINGFQKMKPCDAREVAIVSLGSNTHHEDRYIDKEVMLKSSHQTMVRISISLKLRKNQHRGRTCKSFHKASSWTEPKMTSTNGSSVTRDSLSLRTTCLYIS